MFAISNTISIEKTFKFLKLLSIFLSEQIIHLFDFMYECTEFHNPILPKNGKDDTTIIRSGYPKHSSSKIIYRIINQQ